MATLERTMIISPPRKGNAFEYSDSNQELTLMPFVSKPTLDFGTVKINTRVETSLRITNPSDSDLEVSLSKAPEGFAAVQKFSVPKNSQVIFNVAWRPKQEGNVRQNINLSATPSHPPIKTGLVLIGKCVDPSQGPEWKRAARGSVKAKPQKPAAKAVPPANKPTKAGASAVPPNPSPSRSSKSAKEKEFAKPAPPSEANMPPKKRGFFRSAKAAPAVKVGSSAKGSSTKSEESCSPPPTPVYLVNDATFVSGPTGGPSANETFSVPQPPSTPGPRETFVVVPQPDPAVIGEAETAASKARGTADEKEAEEERERVEQLHAHKFRFPGSLYKKRRSSTPVTSPRERFGSMRSTVSEVVGSGHTNANRSPGLRFAGAVSDRLTGVLTRSKSVGSRKSSRDVADGNDGGKDQSPESFGNPKSPTVMIEEFRRKMQDLKLGGRARLAAANKKDVAASDSHGDGGAVTPKILQSRTSKMNVKAALINSTQVEKAPEDDMVEVDLHADENEGEISNVSMPSTICSPEQPLDLVKKEVFLHGIPEESELNESNKENMGPDDDTPVSTPSSNGFLAAFNKNFRGLLNSVSPKTAKKIGGDGSPMVKHLATKRLMMETGLGDTPSRTMSEKESTLVNGSIKAHEDRRLVLVSRKELAAVRLQAWWFRRRLAQARVAGNV